MLLIEINLTATVRQNHSSKDCDCISLGRCFVPAVCHQSLCSSYTFYLSDDAASLELNIAPLLKSDIAVSRHSSLLRSHLLSIIGRDRSLLGSSKGLRFNAALRYLQTNPNVGPFRRTGSNPEFIDSDMIFYSRTLAHGC